MFTKDLEELKDKQAEMNDTLKGINSRITEAEERIDDLKDRMKEIAAIEQNIEKKNEDSLRDLWDNIKHINIRIIGVPGEQREQGPEKIFEEIIDLSSSSGTPML